MNYWLLTTEYPPLHGGGISTYANLSGQMLSSIGNNVTIFVQDDNEKNYTVIEETSTLKLVRFNSNRSKLNSTLGYTSRLSYEFAVIVRIMIDKFGKPDVIESQDYLGIAYYLTQFKYLNYEFIRDVPIVITLHSPAFIYLEYNRVPIYKFPNFLTCEMEKHALISADLLISPTHFLKDEIKKFINIGNKKCVVLPNPFISNIEHPEHYNKTNEIIYYGKLSPQKGSFELADYFKDLWDQGFPYPLRIIGGTDIVYYPEMKTMGQIFKHKYEYYINKGLLQLTGKISPDQIKKSLKNAHVIVFPSIVDNLPYVIMEAMGMGKIVLASIQGGQREMIEDGESGFLFDHEHPDTFQLQLQKILSLSNQELKRIANNACISINRKYSFEIIREKKLEILNTVIREKNTDNRFPFLYQEKFESINSNENTLLSVIIPYYNMGDYIDECIKSIQASTHKPIEIIIINDGSTDDRSIKKLEEIYSKDITIHHRKNEGLALTRNYGAEIAKGTYLAFLDADDMVATEYYEKAITCLHSNNNVFFAGSWVQYFGNSKQKWPAFTPQPPYVLVHNPVNSSGLVYKKEAFLKGGLNDKKLDYGLEDYESVINMMHHGYNGVILPEFLFHYRVRSGSMFRNMSIEKLLYSNKYISEKHAVYYGKFASEIVNILNANGPGFLFENPGFEVKVRSSTSKDNVVILWLKSFIRKHEITKKIALSIKKMKS